MGSSSLLKQLKDFQVIHFKSDHFPKLLDDECEDYFAMHAELVAATISVDLEQSEFSFEAYGDRFFVSLERSKSECYTAKLHKLIYLDLFAPGYKSQHLIYGDGGLLEDNLSDHNVHCFYQGRLKNQDGIVAVDACRGGFTGFAMTKCKLNGI